MRAGVTFLFVSFIILSSVLSRAAAQEGTAAPQEVQLADFVQYEPFGGWNRDSKEALGKLDSYLTFHPLTDATKSQPDAADIYGVVYVVRGWEAARVPDWRRLYDLSAEFLGMFPDANNVAGQVMAEWRLGAAEMLPDKRGEVTAAAEVAAKKLLEGGPLTGTSGADIPPHVAAALLAGKGAPAAAEFLLQLQSRQPAVLADRRYWEKLITACILAGMATEAREAAVMYFRLCLYDTDSVQASLSKLLEVWKASGGKDQLDAVITYVETGQGENPFAEVKRPVVSEAQFAAMLAPAWRPHQRTAIYLYAGRFKEAMGMAMQSVFNGTAGLEEIARCFKAEDANLVRANQYINFMKTGQGENPLMSYQVGY